MSTTEPLLKTPLHDWHVAHGGRMVDFAGWSMPVQYSSIVEEHLATRQAVGLFDISHMGRLLIDGPDSSAFLDSLLTRKIVDMRPHQIRYSLVCNETGGILDDVLAYRAVLGDDDPPGLALVVNASNRAKIVAWLESHAGGHSVEVRDKTIDYAMIALQGPKAIEILDSFTPFELTSMRYYTGQLMEVAGVECFVSRTGYTGEDGGELICDADKIVGIWQQLIDAAERVGGRAVGLAARDTLRLEAGMPLYGHELSDQINPVEAGLDFAINLRDREFIGKQAIEAAGKTNQTVRVGLQLEDRRVPRESCSIWRGEEPVGTVTSGTFSPTFDQPIAMGYVKSTAAAAGTSLDIDIRGKQYPAKVVPLPFYERGK
ncbi:MAG: glycine cleavage system aminomethyltransferase GcvT [Planctomycetales bacterium]|nr:glycine cleavage system aminomethyltransferase GcvT [Planctomycetales bacterium]